MKKIILALTLLLMFGLSFGTNPNEVKINDNSSSNKELIITANHVDNINLLEAVQTIDNTVITETISDSCSRFGGMIFEAALADGYSFQEAVDLGTAATVVCRVLVAVGMWL